MAVDRTNSQKQAEQTFAGENHGQSQVKLTGANPPARPSYGADDAPSVRLSGVSATGRRHGHGAPPVPPAPAASPAGRSAASAPAFTVTAVSASGAGNASLKPGADMYAESPAFISSAKVRAPASPEVANWDIGYIQTVTDHFFE